MEGQREHVRSLGTNGGSAGAPSLLSSKFSSEGMLQLPSLKSVSFVSSEKSMRLEHGSSSSADMDAEGGNSIVAAQRGFKMGSAQERKFWCSEVNALNEHGLIPKVLVASQDQAIVQKVRLAVRESNALMSVAWSPEDVTVQLNLFEFKCVFLDASYLLEFLDATGSAHESVEKMCKSLRQAKTKQVLYLNHDVTDPRLEFILGEEITCGNSSDLPSVRLPVVILGQDEAHVRKALDMVMDMSNMVARKADLSRMLEEGLEEARLEFKETMFICQCLVSRELKSLADVCRVLACALEENKRVDEEAETHLQTALKEYSKGAIELYRYDLLQEVEDWYVSKDDKIVYESDPTGTGTAAYLQKCVDLGILKVGSAYETMAGQSQNLHLRSYSMGRKGGIALSAGIRLNTFIKKIELRCNDLQAEGAIAIAEGLKHNRTVTYLDISENCIGCEGAKAIAGMLEVNPVLKTLRLQKNEIKDKGAKYLSRALIYLAPDGAVDGYRILQPLAKFPTKIPILFPGPGGSVADGYHATESNLTILDLSKNLIGAVGAKYLGYMLHMVGSCDSHPPLLQEIHLQHNQMLDVGAIHICEGMVSNKYLKLLDVSDNGLEEGGGIALSNMLLKNSSLSILHAKGSNMGREVGNALAMALSKNTTLKRLDLGGNAMGETVVNLMLKASSSIKGGSLESLRSNRNAKYFHHGTDHIPENSRKTGGPFRHGKRVQLFDINDPDGHYHLNLSLPWDTFLLQQLLNLQRQGPGRTIWNEKLDGVSCRIGSSALTPTSGILQFDYVSDTKKVLYVEKYHFDLSLPHDYEFAQSLKQRALQFSGSEGWKFEELAGLPFKLPYDPNWKLPVRSQLELAYCIYKFHPGLNFDPNSPDADYILNLKLPWDRLVAMKLYEMAEAIGPECWINPRLNNLFFRMNVDSDGHFLWALPKEGVLKFTFRTRKKEGEFTKLFQLDMSDPWEQWVAGELWGRVLNNGPLESWQSITLDADSYNPLKCRERKGWAGEIGKDIPKTGILRFLHQVVDPNRIQVEIEVLNMERDDDRIRALKLRDECLVNLESSMSRVTLDQEKLQLPLSKDWLPPMRGLLRIRLERLRPGDKPVSIKLFEKMRKKFCKFGENEQARIRFIDDEIVGRGRYLAAFMVEDLLRHWPSCEDVGRALSKFFKCTVDYMTLARLVLQHIKGMEVEKDVENIQNSDGKGISVKGRRRSSVVIVQAHKAQDFRHRRLVGHFSVLEDEGVGRILPFVENDSDMVKQVHLFPLFKKKRQPGGKEKGSK